MLWFSRFSWWWLPRTSWLLLPVSLLILLLLSAMLVHGSVKPAAEWIWLDIVGEGGTTALIFCWLHWVARSRPGGRVTRLLMLGLSLVLLAMWADTLDEFIRLPPAVSWDHWLESALMPAGLLLLTLGIYHWHQEQLAINLHMHKRERLFREHRHFDALTPLTGAAYLRRQIQRELATNTGFALIALDLNGFTAVNQRHGYAEGDRVLQTISQLLLLNLRHGDLLCRLAGDRFVALLPATPTALAEQMAEDLRAAVAHLAYRVQGRERLSLQASTLVVCPPSDSSVEEILAQLGRPVMPAAPTTMAYA